MENGQKQRWILPNGSMLSKIHPKKGWFAIAYINKQKVMCILYMHTYMQNGFSKLFINLIYFGKYSSNFEWSNGK